MSRIHLIYAGDHGQGTLRSALKLIFIKVDDEDSQCVSECIAEIVQIDCEKDDYQVLQSTYIPKRDKIMEEMQRPESRIYLPGDSVSEEDKNTYLISYRNELNN